MSVKILKLFLLICVASLAGCTFLYPNAPPWDTAPGTSGSNPNSQAGGADGSPSDQGSKNQPSSALNLQQISMQYNASGWGLAENDVFRTEDGGVSWFSVTPTGLTEVGASATAYFLDTSTAWLLIPDLQDPAQGTLYRSADAGASWQSAQVPFSSGYFDFIDPLTGWNLFITGAAAGSSAAQLFHTTDGGISWSLVSETDPDRPLDPEHLPFSGNKTGISFFDELHGWLTGSVPVAGNIYLYRTDDGGKTWNPQQLKLSPGLETSMFEAFPPQVFTNKHGKLPIRITGPVPQTIVYTTINAGQDWKSTFPIESSGAVSFSSMQSGFVWDGGTIFGSLDGGMTWLHINPDEDFSQSLVQFQFVDSLRGWALALDEGGTHRLFYTEDSGIHWRRLP